MSPPNTRHPNPCGLRALLWLALGAPACVPDTTPTLDSPVATFDIATERCDGSTHPILDHPLLGTIVDVQPVPSLDLTREQILAFGTLAGLEFETAMSWGAKVWRVRYVTQDRGELTEATALIALPVGMTDKQRVSSIIYGQPSSGFVDMCAPSKQDAAWSAMPLLLASKGFAVVAPDLLGLTGLGPSEDRYHPYLVAEATALASLDALRALWTFADSDDALPATVEPTTRTGILGNSEGGFAAMWTERYAPHYLPEADVLGVVAAVAPTNLVDITQRSVQQLSVATAGMPMVFRAMQGWYDIDEDILDLVQPHQHDFVIDQMENHCPDAVLPPEVAGVDDIWVESFRQDILAGDWSPWSCFAEENSIEFSDLPRLSDTPMLMVIAQEDEVSITDVQRESFQALCAQGYDLQWRECTDGGHYEAAVSSVREQSRWLADRMAGIPLEPSSTCVFTEPTPCDVPDSP